MFGGQQIPAYKTLMKKSRYLPRHSEHDVRLYRVIVWGAVIILAVFIAGIVAAKIASFEYAAAPLFVAAIPIALGLLFFWWWIDVAPVASRWLIACIASILSVGCFALVWIAPAWEQVQLAALTVYMVAVSVEAWQQIRAGAGKQSGAGNA